MKALYLIRHAKSSWDYPALKDIDRPLGSRGLKDAPKMARFLKEEGVVPDKIVSSPAKRAHSTAIFFAKAQNINPDDIRLDIDVYHAYADDILSIIRDWPNEWNTVFLFGHNPTFTTVANFFADQSIDNVPTCGIVAIQLDTERWKSMKKGGGKVLHFWYPKLFK